MSRHAYDKVRCQCGRYIGSNVIRQHRRKCPVQQAQHRRRQELQDAVNKELERK